MFHRWAALVLVLALCAFTPKHAAGQQSTTTQPRERGAGSLGKAFPNPFNPETHIRFTVGQPGCADMSTHTVTIQILNILAQLVAIPVLEDAATTATSPVAGGLGPVSNMHLSCGNYSAFWNGNLQGTVREAPSGTYVVRLIVDGKPAGTSRIFNSK